MPCHLRQGLKQPWSKLPLASPTPQLFFFHLLFFISLLLPVHCSIASVSAAALNHESYESFGFSLFLGGYSLFFIYCGSRLSILKIPVSVLSLGWSAVIIGAIRPTQPLSLQTSWGGWQVSFSSKNQCLGCWLSIYELPPFSLVDDSLPCVYACIYTSVCVQWPFKAYMNTIHIVRNLYSCTCIWICISAQIQGQIEALLLSKRPQLYRFTFSKHLQCPGVCSSIHRWL